MSKIKIKLLNDDCMPERTHRWDAGWDLKATEDTLIPVGESRKIHTGVIIEIPPRHCGMVAPRSSLGTKHGITLANTVGIIDTEYRGEIMVFLVNNGSEDYTVHKGDRFAQLVVVAIDSSELWVVDRVSETSRGTGGFGSTDLFDMSDEELSENANIPETTFEDKLMAVSESIKEKTGMNFSDLSPVEQALYKAKEKNDKSKR